MHVQGSEQQGKLRQTKDRLLTKSVFSLGVFKESIFGKCGNMDSLFGNGILGFQYSQNDVSVVSTSEVV